MDRTSGSSVILGTAGHIDHGKTALVQALTGIDTDRLKEERRRGITSELGVSPVPPALGVGLAASCAFMMPIATGPNAIVYGTGRVPLPSMIRVGLVLNLMCAVIVFAMVRLLVPAYGWM